MKTKLAIILCAILMTIAFVGVGNGQVLAYDNGSGQAEEKIYCSATIEDDFEDNKIIIVLTKEASFHFKEYTIEDFVEVDCVEVIDLTSYSTKTIKEALAQYGSMGKVKEELEKNTLINLDEYRTILALTLSTRDKANVLMAIKQLEQREDILSAEPNYMFSQNAQSSYGSETVGNRSINGNELWGLENINAYDAWGFTQGSSSVKVGVIDSGYDKENRTIDEGVDSMITNADKVDGGFSSYYHGEMVVSVIESVAKNVSINIYEYTYTSLHNLCHYINYAALKNMSIINFSAGKNVNSSTLESALKSYNGLFVCSAGNQNDDIDEQLFYPANFSNLSNVITVGAIGANNDRWDSDEENGSNYGENTVSIYAPGEDIIGNVPTCICDENPIKCLMKRTHKEYGIHMDSGTSFAAPHVTGVAALLLSVNGNLSAPQLKEAILTGADSIEITLPDGTKQNVKKLNAIKALSKALGSDYIIVPNGDKTLDIKGLSDDSCVSLQIPSTIRVEEESWTVTRIASDAFKSYTNITSVTIPASITQIGESAFEGCSELSTIVFADESKLTQIGACAFKGCTLLTKISLPQFLTSIGESAFEGCCQLEDVSFEGESKLTQIGACAFKNCGWLSIIVLPESLTSIESYAFQNAGLLSVNIGEKIAFIGNKVFEGCPIRTIFYNSTVLQDCEEADMLFYGLTSISIKIQIGNAATRIPAYLFNNLPNVTSIEFGQNVQSIGAYAFNGCSGVTDLVLPNSLQSIGEYAFGRIGISTLSIPASVTDIGDGAFCGASLDDVEVDEENTSFMLGVNCIVKISNSTLIVGTNTGEIPDGVITIASGAFSGTSIEEIEIPASVKTINNGAFWNCENLTTIWLMRTAELGITVIWDMYSGDITDVYPSLESIIVPNVESFVEYEDCLLIREELREYITCDPGPFRYEKLPFGTYAISKGKGVLAGDVIIPSTFNGKAVTQIASNAFEGCSAVLSIKVPSSVTKLNNNAFTGCIMLANVYLPEKVVALNDSVFSGCQNLIRIIVPNKAAAYNGYVSQLSDQNLKNKVQCEKNGLEFTLLADGTYEVGKGDVELIGEIIIPATYNAKAVTKIAENGFESCRGITSVIMPSSVMTIGDNAFAGCTLLSNVYLPSGVAQINDTAFSNCTALKRIVVPNNDEIYNGYVSQLESQSLKKKVYFEANGLLFRALEDGTYEVNGIEIFESALAIPRIYNEQSVTRIGEYAFNNSEIEDLILPMGITEIGSYAFSGCNNLGVVALLRTAEQGITQISPTAFDGSDNVCFVVFDEDSYYAYYEHFISIGREDYAAWLQFIMYL